MQHLYRYSLALFVLHACTYLEATKTQILEAVSTPQLALQITHSASKNDPLFKPPKLAHAASRRKFETRAIRAAKRCAVLRTALIMQITRFIA